MDDLNTSINTYERRIATHRLWYIDFIIVSGALGYTMGYRHCLQDIRDRVQEVEHKQLLNQLEREVLNEDKKLITSHQTQQNED